MLPPILFAALSALVLLLVASVRRIPQGHVYTFRRVGGHVRMVGSGTHWVMPLVERVEHKISLGGATVAIDDLRRDGQTCRGTVYFQVLDPERAEVVIEDVDEHVRAATRRLFAAAELPTDDEARRQWLKQTLNADLRDYGLLVARVDLEPLG